MSEIKPALSPEQQKALLAMTEKYRNDYCRLMERWTTERVVHDQLTRDIIKRSVEYFDYLLGDPQDPTENEENDMERDRDGILALEWNGWFFRSRGGELQMRRAGQSDYAPVDVTQLGHPVDTELMEGLENLRKYHNGHTNG